MRKYQTEYALYAKIVEGYLLRPNNLDSIAYQTVKDCHLYAVLSVPRIFIKENSITQTAEFISMEVFSSGDPARQIRFCIDKSIDHTKVNIETEYPYTVLTMKHEGELESTSHTASFLYYLCMNRITISSPLEVLYIGQSYGGTGERNARDRLLNHKTLQKILSECQVEYPNREILVILMGIDHGHLFSSVPSSQATAQDNESDDKHTAELFSNLPAETQVVNVVEAAMIHFFKPPYNSKFTGEFPKPKDRSYRHYYNLDYNAIIIEFQLEFNDLSQSLQFFTRANSLSCDGGIIQYPLNNKTERASMFELFDE